MKKIFTVILTVVLLNIFAVSAYAATKEHKINNVSFNLDSSYTIHTIDNLNPTSKVEGLIFAAMTNDGSHQLQGRCTETNFSKGLKTFKGLDAESIAPAGNELFPNGYSVTVFNSMPYIKSIYKEGDSFTVIYVTVSNGKLYTFTYFGEDPTQIGEFMSSLKLPDVKMNSKMNVMMAILISICIIVISILIGFLIYSFIKDYRHYKMEKNRNIVSNFIKIKRRKF